MLVEQARSEQVRGITHVAGLAAKVSRESSCAPKRRPDEWQLMLARYYGAELRRFTTPDLILIKKERLILPQRINLYGYAANNPIKYTDPTGADVHVGNRPVGGTLGAASHAFIVVTPTGANKERYKDRVGRDGTITLSGFPGAGDRLVKSQNDGRDTGRAAQTIEVASPTGTSMEQFEQNVIEAFDSYNNDAEYDSVPYMSDGFNSNSLASGILTAAGAETTMPTDEQLDGANPGWNQPVTLPNATANDKNEDKSHQHFEEGEQEAEAAKAASKNQPGRRDAGTMTTRSIR